MIKKYFLLIIMISGVIISCKKDNPVNTCIVGKWKYVGAESFDNFIPLDSYDHYTFYPNEDNKGQFLLEYISPDTSYKDER